MRILKSRRARIQAAITELEATISACHPTAVFAVTTGPEDPRQVWLHVGIDIEDPSDVHDLVLDRLVELHIDEVPIYVIPTPRLEVRGSTWPPRRMRPSPAKRRTTRPARRDSAAPRPLRRRA